MVDKFEESKENKLEYTEVFTSYTSFVESSLEKHLSSKIPVNLNDVVFIFCLDCINTYIRVQGFTMAKFERFVMERRGEYFHFLHSLQHNIPVPVLYAHLICSH